MNMKIKTVKEEDGSVRLFVEPLEVEPKPKERAPQKRESWHRSDGNMNSEYFHARFIISEQQTVTVETFTRGKVYMSPKLIDLETHTPWHAFPANGGGQAELYPGRWELVLDGWISTYPSPAEIRSVIHYEA